jgi:hypothetical protein
MVVKLDDSHLWVGAVRVTLARHALLSLICWGTIVLARTLRRMRIEQRH